MLNKLWPFLVVISVIFSIFCGRINFITSTIFNSLEDTVKFVFSFLGIMCFWSGMINIVQKTGAMKKMEKLLKPFINYFFRGESDEVKDLIAINKISNIIVIGNAATPVGIEAMKKMNENNNTDKLTKNMKMFVLLNTLSIQIFPTTLVSIMASLGSNCVGSILLPIWITTILTFGIIFSIGNILFKMEEK